MANAFEVWIAVAAVLTAVAYTISPESLDDTTIAQVSPGIAATWNGLYAGAGLSLLYGLFKPMVKWEIAGLSLLCGALAIQGVAAIYVRGPAGITGGVLFTSLIVAATSRMWLLTKFARRE